MRLREKQKIVDAYNNLIKRLEEVGLEEIDGFLGKEQVLKISKNDYKVLEPFLNADITRKYKIGEVELISREKIALGVYEFPNGVGLLIHYPINQFISDLQNMIFHVVQNPNKRSIPAKYYYGAPIEMGVDV